MSVTQLRPLVQSTDNPSPDAWLAALDRKVVGTGSSRWIVSVLGVHVVGAEAWIQIARDNDPDDTLVLHVGSATTVAAVLTALEARAGATTGSLLIEASPR